MFSHRQDGPSKETGVGAGERAGTIREGGGKPGSHQGPKRAAEAGGCHWCPSLRESNIQEGTKCLPAAHQVVVSGLLQSLQSSLCVGGGADSKARS